MFESQRLDGLEMLRSIKAPVPNWQIVKNLRDVDLLELQQVDYGWTIRTCRTDGKREIGLFYLNYAGDKELIEVLRDRVAKSSLREFYIVYPSWEFRFSCNIVLENQIYTIEGKYGSQKDLALGKCGPDFGIRIPYGLRSQMYCYYGNPNREVLDNLGRIIRWCKCIPWESFSSEVALRHDSTLIFYELFNLRITGNEWRSDE